MIKRIEIPIFLAVLLFLIIMVAMAVRASNPDIQKLRDRPIRSLLEDTMSDKQIDSILSLPRIQDIHIENGKVVGESYLYANSQAVAIIHFGDGVYKVEALYDYIRKARH